MKKILQTIGLVTVITGFCALVAGMLYAFTGAHFRFGTLRQQDAASIGIIGGADGPTSVFISDKAALSVFLAAALNCIATATALLLRLRKHLRPKK